MYRFKLVKFTLNETQHVYRHYSKEGKRPTFISRLYDNLKDEMAKNKEMKESLKKFRDEAQKLEESDALKAARQKFESVEKEASKGSEVFKERFSTIKDKVQGVIDEAGKTDIAKKASKLTGDIGKTVTHNISERAQVIGKTSAFQTITEASKAVKKEIDTESIQGRVYQSPAKLRKRTETSDMGNVNKFYEPNTEALGIELHKDSKFYESWQNFKDNNPYVHKVIDWKLKYDESENPVIRASRVLTEKVSDIMGGLFQKTELSETLTEICKIDNSFEQKRFLKQCEVDIIPNILEAMTRGDLDILKDWCHEGPFNLFAVPIKEAYKKGYRIESKILDIDNVDLVMGKVMDQGPVLIITFTSQQIMCVKDASGGLVEGDPEKVMRVSYVWVLCRDPSELNPRAAWRLLDLSASSNVQFV
ncbi:PREDICTED: mitochondrial import inner membrane translocase subunit TIM44 [Nicrophorus vespilloides]|uniref:Mitochondrial import inner membrane translocase subunit TIM44 n=1 Tax=Nicrophorus vespilloides TaxID=110193 RepID=A0ABM1MZ67_NICVS|nr:PREDICTED: mitochondrial import inner membrane translocase subunit TIM44 [Nicrophorus vespilloides]XP_017779868.1 PREDICTED: mitochondrial import inner membrane translocase subunit TIM44 [Nicrophorus vespilloides]